MSRTETKAPRAAAVEKLNRLLDPTRGRSNPGSSQPPPGTRWSRRRISVPYWPPAGPWACSTRRRRARRLGMAGWSPRRRCCGSFLPPPQIGPCGPASYFRGPGNAESHVVVLVRGIVVVAVGRLQVVVVVVPRAPAETPGGTGSFAARHPRWSFKRPTPPGASASCAHARHDRPTPAR